MASKVRTNLVKALSCQLNLLWGFADRQHDWPVAVRPCDPGRGVWIACQQRHTCSTGHSSTGIHGRLCWVCAAQLSCGCASHPGDERACYDAVLVSSRPCQSKYKKPAGVPATWCKAVGSTATCATEAQHTSVVCTYFRISPGAPLKRCLQFSQESGFSCTLGRTCS